MASTRSAPRARGLAASEAEMVSSVEDIVQRFARKYGVGLDSADVDDLVAAGRIGALEAARRYVSDDPRGATFATFATYGIRARVMDAAFARWRAGRCGASNSLRKVFYERARAVAAIEARGEVASIAAVAAEIGVPEGAVELARSISTWSSRSLDEVRNQDCDLGAAFEVADDAPTAEEMLVDFERVIMLRAAIDMLPRRQRDAVVAVYVDDEPVSSVAARIGVTSARVYQILLDAERALKDLVAQMVSVRPPGAP